MPCTRLWYDLARWRPSGATEGAAVSTSSTDLDIHGLLTQLATKHGIQLSYQQAWSLIIAGRIPAHREGRNWRIKEEDMPAIAGNLGPTPTLAA